MADKTFMDLARDWFGKQVTDDLSGFTGKIAGINAFINGCLQVLVVPEAATDLSVPREVDVPAVVVCHEDAHP